MLRYAARRFGYMCLLLLGVSVISFIVINLPQGDYLTTMLENMRASGIPAQRSQLAYLEKKFGLDQPLYIQYFKWMGGVLSGDLGYSFEWGVKVTELIGDRIGLTVIVTLATIFYTWILAFPIAIFSATHQYSPLDYIFTFVAFIGVAIPDFLLALTGAYLLFKATGMAAIGLFSPEYAVAPWNLAKFWDLVKHLGLPIAIVGTSGTGGMIRGLRALLLDELGKPYVITARAKGLKEWRLLWTYPIRLAVNPMLSTIGWMLPGLVSGTVLISVVLNLPMTGPLFLGALRRQDMYLAGAFVLLLSALTIVGTFISDLALMWGDPRIRLGE